MINIIKPKFFPLILLWLTINIAPLAFFIALENDLSNWKTSTNLIILTLAIYLFSYGINYLIGCYYFNKQMSSLTSEAKQSILHLFTITRTFIIVILLGMCVYFLKIKNIQLLLTFLGFELLLFLYHFFIRLFKDRKN